MIRFALAAFFATIAVAQTNPSCPKCAEWNAPQKPFRIYGNTYFVGTHGISSILIASPQGHMLIDGCLYAAPQIVSHIRELGFRVEDVKWLGNSHVHYDHAGSPRRTAASQWSAGCGEPVERRRADEIRHR